MHIADAKDFLQHYAGAFNNRVIADWSWGEDDDIFGKTVSWERGAPGQVDATATVDLTATQLQLTISERDISGTADPRDADSEVLFNGLISFEDQLVTRDGVSLPFNDASIRELISEFNERA